MVKISTSNPDVFIINPVIYNDNRGCFFESYNSLTMESLGITSIFVQDNQSCSEKNVLRGLHFQVPPFAQGKLVRVIKGAVLDVAVDLRKNSPNFGKFVSSILSESNHLMMWIPEGFAHGFLSLEPDTIFTYKCTNVYNKNSERILKWNDELINIDWGTETPIISDRDNQATSFSELESPF